jgi:hypothetical protein
MLQVLHDQAQKVGADEGGALERNSPRVRAESEAGVATPTCMCRRMRTVAVGRARPPSVAAVVRGDNSRRSAQTGAAAMYRRAGRSCMHALWGAPKQSGRRGHGACIPSIGCMHPEKYIAYVVSCRMQRKRIRRVSEQ